MSQKLRDFSKILTDIHADKWVAFSPDYSKVVAYSSDIMDVQKAVKGQDVVYFKAPTKDTVYAFPGTI